MVDHLDLVVILVLQVPLVLPEMLVEPVLPDHPDHLDPQDNKVSVVHQESLEQLVSRVHLDLQVSVSVVPLVLLVLLAHLDLQDPVQHSLVLMSVQTTMADAHKGVWTHMIVTTACAMKVIKS